MGLEYSSRLFQDDSVAEPRNQRPQKGSQVPSSLTIFDWPEMDVLLFSEIYSHTIKFTLSKRAIQSVFTGCIAFASI